MNLVEDRFSRFFERVEKIFQATPKDEALTPTEVEEAAEMLTFSQFSGYRKLVAWLEKEIDRPVPVKPEMLEMIAGVTRQTTMKEVRDQLRRWQTTSEAVMKRYREGDHG